MSKPTIISPLPNLLFTDNDTTLTIVAKFNSSAYPLASASIGVSYGGSNSVACAVTIDGNTITGTVTLAAIQAVYSTFLIGAALTVTVTTTEVTSGEQGVTSFSAATVGKPTVTITSSTSSISEFPFTLAWDYSDYSGFAQQDYTVKLSACPQFGDVEIEEYTSDSVCYLSGREVAYLSSFTGAYDTLSVTLEVTSTSGITNTQTFTLTSGGTTITPTVTHTLSDGTLDITCDNLTFILYALDSGGFRAVADSTDGHLAFSMLAAGTRYFVVAIDTKHMGYGTEVITGLDNLDTARLYYLNENNALNHLDMMLNRSEKTKVKRGGDYQSFAGRKFPVRYGGAYSGSIDADAEFLSLDTYAVLNESTGKEGIYIPRTGSPWRVVIDDVDYDNSCETFWTGKIDVSLTIVDGDPYDLWYDQPKYATKLVYPASTIYPASTLYPRS